MPASAAPRQLSLSQLATEIFLAPARKPAALELAQEALRSAEADAAEFMERARTLPFSVALIAEMRGLDLRMAQALWDVGQAEQAAEKGSEAP